MDGGEIRTAIAEVTHRTRLREAFTSARENASPASRRSSTAVTLGEGRFPAEGI